MPRLLFLGLLLCFSASCATPSPPPGVAETQSEVIRVAIATGIVGTLTAGAPSSTPIPSVTPIVTVTGTSAPSPTALPSPSPTATPSATPTPLPATLAPAVPTATPTPDFVATVLAVRAQMDNFGWQIDYGVRRRALDCPAVIAAYEYVAAHTALSVSSGLAGPYQLYTQGVTDFLANGEALYLGCKAFLAEPNVYHPLSSLTWQNARTRTAMARDLLTQAIVAAGGTP